MVQRGPVIADKNTGKWKPTPKPKAVPKLTLAAQKGAKALTAPLQKTSGSTKEKKTPKGGSDHKPYVAPVTRSTPGSSFKSTESVNSGEPTEQDYLEGDATYQAVLSALGKQLENYQADIQAQKSRYGLDFDKGIRDLGYIAPSEGGDGAWNWDDTLTASGRGYQNQLNDFASRGMTQSSAYADAINNLQRSLMDQYTGMSTAKNTFETDLDRQLASTKDENTAAQQAAKAEAIMRRAMQYGLAV